ncbi:universal stress protein [Mesonia sp.]|uniref:Uncharacterized protein n=2 Tax=Mesonia oceanica TaxID=2687242 RepID=A0AC61YDA8_9FLAO|nr:universal stress protein [Mesonia sp.]VVV01385.1 hypothetical protein FVB9532_02675 [Mesonia oceanica]
MMKRILLPTDFSENAYNAISYALHFFKDEKCHFILLNTLYNSDYIIYSSLNTLYENNSLKKLEQLRKHIVTEFNNPNHEFESVSSFNMLYQEIEERAKNKEIDLIVMGTNGASGGEEILFGTHTVHAIQIAKCPLLAIPSNYKYKELEHILFATKYEIDFAQYQMSLIKNLAEKRNAKIHVMHANFGNRLTDEQLQSKKDLDSFFDETSHDFNSVYKDSVPEAIEEFNKEKPIDLLVMIKHRRSFIEKLLFSSIINEIGFNAKFPFLVLPTESYNPEN